jgi:hypothetical protein
MAVLDQYIQDSDPEIQRKNYDFSTRVATFERSLQPTIPGIQAQLHCLPATRLPAAAQFSPKQFVAGRFLTQLPS